MNHTEIETRVKEFLAENSPLSFATARPGSGLEPQWNTAALNAVVDLCFEIATATRTAVEAEYDEEIDEDEERAIDLIDHRSAFRSLVEVVAEEITARKALQKQVAGLQEANTAEVNRRRLAECDRDCWRDLVRNVGNLFGFGDLILDDISASDLQSGGLFENFVIAINELREEVEKFKAEALANSVASSSVGAVTRELEDFRKQARQFGANSPADLSRAIFSLQSRVTDLSNALSKAAEICVSCGASPEERARVSCKRTSCFYRKLSDSPPNDHRDYGDETAEAQP